MSEGSNLVTTFEGTEDGRSFECILKFTNEGKFVELDGTPINVEEPYWASRWRRLPELCLRSAPSNSLAARRTIGL